MTGRRRHYVTDEVPFPAAEYERRLAAVQELMDDLNLDLLYCTEPESLYYLTGYRNSWFRSHSPRDWTPVTSGIVARDAGRPVHRGGGRRAPGALDDG
jgi:Xaa-Pro aminopeptidase